MGGVKTLYEGSDRYCYDAIEYYKTDIDWFAFIFVAFALDLFISFCEYMDYIEGFFNDSKAEDEKEASELHTLYVLLILRCM